jgi:hypothetical protein
MAEDEAERSRELRRARERRYRQRQREKQRFAAAQLDEGDAPMDSEEDTHMASPTASPIYWTRFTIPGLGFFTYHGTNYDRGQLMPMVGGPRDEQLQRMGYVQPAPTEEEYLRAQCGACGAWFLNEQFRDAHGRLRHSERFQQDDIAIGGGMEGPDGGAALRDVTGDAEERRMQQQYPLYLDKTRATIESSPA